jgi:hypothetical protein
MVLREDLEKNVQSLWHTISLSTCWEPALETHKTVVFREGASDVGTLVLFVALPSLHCGQYLFQTNIYGLTEHDALISMSSFSGSFVRTFGPFPYHCLELTKLA